MRLSVSDINSFLGCEWDWWARSVARRVPRRPAAELYAGTFWHETLATLIKTGSKEEAKEKALPRLAEMRDAIDAFGDPAETKKFVDQGERLLSLFDHYSDFVGDQETLLVETPLEAALPHWAGASYTHTLCGTPDRVLRTKDGKVWSVQYKTVSDRVPPAVYVASQERSLHELVYRFLIEQHLDLNDNEYGGTILNVVRKLSHKAIKERPETAFIQEMIPIRPEETRRALFDIAVWADRMETIRRGCNPTQNRMADVNRFSNALSPYWDARRGLVSLDDDRFFEDAPDRYATPSGQGDKGIEAEPPSPAHQRQ